MTGWPLRTLTKPAASVPPVPSLSKTITSPNLYPDPGVITSIKSNDASVDFGIDCTWKNPVSIGFGAIVASKSRYRLKFGIDSILTNCLLLKSSKVLPANLVPIKYGKPNL